MHFFPQRAAVPPREHRGLLSHLNVGLITLPLISDFHGAEMRRDVRTGVWPRAADVWSEGWFSILISLPGEQHLCVTTNSCIHPELCQDSQQMQPEAILRNWAFREKKKKTKKKLKTPTQLSVAINIWNCWLSLEIGLNL